MGVTVKAGFWLGLVFVLGSAGGAWAYGERWNVSVGGNGRPEGAARLGILLGSGHDEDFYVAGGSGIGVDVLRDTTGRLYYDASSLLPVGIYGLGALLYTLEHEASTVGNSGQREGGFGAAFLIMLLAPVVTAPLWVFDLEIVEGKGPFALYQRHQLDYFVPGFHWREKLSAGCWVRPFVRTDYEGSPAAWLGVRLGYYRSFARYGALRSQGLEASLLGEW